MEQDDLVLSDLRHWLFVGAFCLVVLVYIASPFQAVRWGRAPFAGMLVEKTALITDYRGRGWGHPFTGLRHPQRVTELGGHPLASIADYHSAVDLLLPGSEVTATTLLPDGTTQRHTLTVLRRFPTVDLIRLFWLPYSVGLVYLMLGFWVYTLRWQTAAGRAFAVFCIVTALVLGLMFDLVSGHAGTQLWTVAIALEGSVLISLALYFPRSRPILARHPWAAYTPYALSALLGAWGVLALQSTASPWAYVTVWRAGYTYAAVGIVVFVATMAGTALRKGEAAAGLRQQARAVLLGSLLAFAPIAVWFASPLVGARLPFTAGLYLPPLLLFPVSIAVATVRYRLWDIDRIVNRALVYGVLTAILGGLYAGGVLGLEALLESQIASAPSLAVAISTLAIATLFRPLRERVQRFIDRKFYRQKYDTARILATFDETLREELELSYIAGRLISCVQQALQPTEIELWLATPDGYCLATGEPLCPDDTPDGSAGSGAASAIRVAADGGARAPDGDLVPLKAALPSALLAAAEPVSTEGLATTAAERQALQNRKIRVLVPLVSHGELVGWLGLGPRLSEQPFSYGDRALLRDLASRAGPALRVAQLVRVRQREALERERIEHEMRFARLIQETLLPSTTPLLPNWKLAVHWQPARAVGGDFYDLLTLPDGRLAIVIADVADKGIPAALVMATTRPILRGAARWGKPPSEALSRANELLLPELPPGMFVTCLYALLDPASGRLQYANAGHNPPLLRHRDGTRELWAAGMALGLLPDSQYEEHEATIEPGETLLFYSDGLTEAHNREREMFGLGRIEEALSAHGTGAQHLVDGLLGDLQRFKAERHGLEDDVTILALSYLDGREG